MPFLKIKLPDTILQNRNKNQGLNPPPTTNKSHP